MKHDWIVFTPVVETMSDVLFLPDSKPRCEPKSLYSQVDSDPDAYNWLSIPFVALLCFIVWFTNPDAVKDWIQKAVNVWEEKVEYVPETAELQEKDMRFVRTYIRSRVGVHTYTQMIRDKCLDVVAYKLSVFDSTWQDRYCANEYRYIEQQFKNDIMMYMTYRYEASQPIALLNNMQEIAIARN